MYQAHLKDRLAILSRWFPEVEPDKDWMVQGYHRGLALARIAQLRAALGVGPNADAEMCEVLARTRRVLEGADEKVGQYLELAALLRESADVDQ